MTPRDFCEQVCRQAKAAGIGLKMDKTPDGWSWAWSHGDRGTTTAHTQPVALLEACKAYINPIASVRSWTQ